MSYTSVNIDANEFLENLELNEKKRLIQMLKADLKEEFDKPIEGEAPLEFTSSVEIDNDDVLDNLSFWERQDLYEDLHDEFGEEPDEPEPQTIEEIISSESSTYSEEELGKALISIWESRMFLNPSQIERIQAITKESYV